MTPLTVLLGGIIYIVVVIALCVTIDDQPFFWKDEEDR